MSAMPSNRGVWRHLPNALSALRLLAVPLLCWLALTKRETAFTWILVAALLSDIADGWIARRFSLESPLGAFLDTVADSALLLVSVFGIWVFHRYVFTQHALLCSAAVGLWALENVLALARYGRLSSFHTLLAKVTANLLGAFMCVLFVFGLQPWMLWLAAGASILTSLEEIALLAVLPEWRRDVRGLWWVLREKAR